MQHARVALQKPKFPLERFVPNPQLKFMEQCREGMRFRRLGEGRNRKAET